MSSSSSVPSSWARQPSPTWARTYFILQTPGGQCLRRSQGGQAQGHLQAQRVLPGKAGLLGGLEGLTRLCLPQPLPSRRRRDRPRSTASAPRGLLLATGLLHGCSADMTPRCLPLLAGCPPGHSADVSGTDLPLSSPPGGGAEVTAPALPVTGTAPVSPTSPLAAAGRSCARRTAPRPSLQ